jgi:hypothetical protein
LRISTLPVKFILSLSFIASFLLCFILGLRGLTVILVSLGTTVPMYLVVYAIVGLVVPPGLELVAKNDLRLDK